MERKGYEIDAKGRDFHTEWEVERVHDYKIWY
jgi:hypothetical protein